ncbi:hypothetical protein L3Y34_018302 [Caenorhabditis briggsae]|uniref:Uncharacterized protein n=1 Tax=Caenorhabditis briggsae TaxID=6238 RepID=A0AAE9DKZ0_CAEBR|nr:hypothetical protein L3Y34_018302 [Caenorhabditis briggsae]
METKLEPQIPPTSNIIETMRNARDLSSSPIISTTSKSGSKCGTPMLSLVEEYQKKDHEKCSSEAETLAEHAKCLIQLEDYAHRNRLIHRKRLFVRTAKMSLGMTGYNTTDFDRKIVRIISPRIMSVIPQEEEAKNNESVSQPTILSPVMLCSLILSPAIYGVMIMSPWLMVPVIISPRLLSPVAVNPFLMVPIIISPLAFNPFILCPGSMNPFVLSPLVFTPFILSPQVLTPLILTPFCLGPIILNPLALSPLVLSPFVLSPTILSPQYVTAVVLSPYALSPAWGSDGAMVTVFASPSWLS